MSEISLRSLDGFGEVSAEDDNTLLDYFVSTSTVNQIENDEKFLVLGRKGSGKTALVRYFTEGQKGSYSISLNLRKYPWSIHAKRVDKGTDPVDAYVASWRYLIAVEVASWALERSEHRHLDAQGPLRKFFDVNYGSSSPDLAAIIRPRRLTLKGVGLSPSVLGNAIGSVDLDRGSEDHNLGFELDALSNAILEKSVDVIRSCRLDRFYLHFDELDAGMGRLDETRKSMLIGLILAARDLRRYFRERKAMVTVAVYLRTDIWDDLAFSDKNKITQGQALKIEWSNDALRDVIDARLEKKFGENANWESVIDNQLMRGSQSKWNHIVARTLKRPRDVIQFLNSALSVAKSRTQEPLIFTNKDIVDAREGYSTYLKQELDDEVLPHWPQWDEALQTCSAISTETFKVEKFEEEYNRRRSSENQMDYAEALRLLHRFSVIGYETRSGYGGTSWAFQYDDPDRGWDAHASRFKVHPGLKEFAKLREERK